MMGIIKDNKIIDQIESALSEIRPFLENDGGDIRFVELSDDWIVKVKLLGACSSCDISMMTLKNGVEAAIKNAVPKVKGVIEVSAK
jgi:Fe-S cluster biogenesis protein NfuA